jgi:acyl-CoA synthetase (AMP-forming)/AMP-acid ligase II
MTILEPEELDRKVLSVGKPVLGADIRILDENDLEVEPGEIGEIVGRGRLVMAGYQSQDTRSASVIRGANNGFGELSSQRLSTRLLKESLDKGADIPTL